MNKKLLLIILFFVIAIPAYAQNDDTGEVNRGPTPPIRERVTPAVKPVAGDEEDLRTEKPRIDARTAEDVRIQKTGVAREEMRIMMQKSEDFRRVPEVLRQKILDQKEKFDERLSKFKDEKKRDLAEKINESIQKLNQRLTAHFLDTADKLTEILKRIENRAEKAEDRGADITSVTSAIKKARTSISALIEATKTQQNKVYDVKVSESTARTDFGKTRKEFFADIEALKVLAQQARVDVRKAATAVSIIKESQSDEDEDENETPKVSPVETISPTKTPAQ